MRYISASLIIVCLMAASAIGKKCRRFKSQDDYNKEHKIYIAGDHAKDEAAAEAKALYENEREICKNNEDPDATEIEGLNDFEELTREEMENEKFGEIPADDSDVEERSYGLIPLTEAEERQISTEMYHTLKDLYKNLDAKVARLPRSYDSRTLGLVTVPKNQASCGSCAAFSATSVIETCMLKSGARLQGMDLSEQFPINCGFDGRTAKGCHGATPHVYHQFATNNHEFPHETQYPYQDDAATLRCPAKKKFWHDGAKVTQFIADYKCNENKMKYLVYTFGSVTASIYAGDKTFSNYKSGVMTRGTPTSIKKPNHAVVVVGWGEEKGIPYWIVKNSWGPNWGDKGFIKVKRGVNLIHIDSTCVTAKCKPTGQYDAVPPTPKPKQIPVNLKCDISRLVHRRRVNGDIQLNIEKGGVTSTKRLTCENSVCTPTATGPSNACMYICGKTKC